MTNTTPLTKITGNTYPVRRELRAMGGEWDADHKCWYVPTDRADEARSLVADTGTARKNSSRRYYDQRARGELTRIGGGRGYLGTDNRGRAHFGTACSCEDYPCCGH